MDDLDRLFQRLVQSIRESRPEYLTRPFEISELHQQLVPYRLYRRELQIDSNQDYEAAVTRLLSGERGYVVGDEGMQEFLRTELASPNPDTAVFREFGSNHVAIANGALERLGLAAGPVRTPREVERTEEKPTPEKNTRAASESSEEKAPISASAIETALEIAPPETSVAEEATETTTAPERSDQPSEMPASRFVTASDVGGKCRYCAGALPDGRRIVFCPHCGQNLTVNRCPACSTELEIGWKYCVTCGRSSAAPSG
jgi:hypothetical protein